MLSFNSFSPFENGYILLGVRNKELYEFLFSTPHNLFSI